MESLKRTFSEEGSSSEFQPIIQQKIDEIKSEIASLRTTSSASIAERALSREEVRIPCAHCGREAKALLGVNKGDTAHANCEIGHSFAIHRTSNGSVIYGGEPEAHDLGAYERILKRQKVPLLPASVLDGALSALGEAFNLQDGHRFPSRAEFEKSVLKIIVNKGIEPEGWDGKDLWMLGYKGRIFNFLPDGGGIELRNGLSYTMIGKEIRTRLVERILNEATLPIDAEKIVSMLACSDEAKVEVAEAIRVFESGGYE